MLRLAGCLLTALALLLLSFAVHDVDSQRPVARRPEIKGLFVYDSCRTFAEGLDFNVTCGAENTTTLLSMTTALITNSGLGVEYIISMNDEYVSQRLPNNRKLAQNIALTYEVSDIKLKYKLDIEARVPDRYLIQRDTGADCSGGDRCDGALVEAAPGENCDTTKPYVGGDSFATHTFRNPAEEFYKELAIVSTADMYRGFSAAESRCGAASCYYCEQPGTVRDGCDTERFLFVAPMWSVFAISPWPSIAFSIRATLRNLDTGEQEVINLGTQLNMSPNGTLYRESARASSPSGTFIIELLQYTTLLPYPAVTGHIIAAEAHPNASTTCSEDGDPSICAVATQYEANQRCTPGSDARKIYCPIFDAWNENAVDGSPEVNPRSLRCAPGPRYWAFVQQNVNGWEHGYECNQNGIRPDWYTKNNGLNSAIVCGRQKGACVPGYDRQLTGGLSARKLPAFYPQQNAEQRNSQCTARATNGQCTEYTCDERAPVNTPIQLQSNVGDWNTWLADGFMWAKPVSDTNIFIDVNALISGVFVSVDRIRGSGYLQSAGAEPCIVVRGRDGGFIVEVCNDSPIGSDYGVTLSCPTDRYQFNTGSTTISVPGNQCLPVGPINIRLQSDVVLGGEFCRATLTELATFSVIDELDERCDESAPRRQEPLGSGQSGTTGTATCSGVVCGLSVNLTFDQFAWLIWSFGLGLIIIIIAAVIFLGGSFFVSQVATKAL